MELRIYFSPAEAASASDANAINTIYIVIDVIRATTSLAVICERGARRVLIADSVERAREAARQQSGRFLLCGERNALPLPDFDYGNSPVQFSQADLAGRELILTTTNGTGAFFACPQESVRLAGSFYNARAATAYALARARERDGDIAIVCAAGKGLFALDDAACAGFLACELQSQCPEMQVHESVLAALALYQAYPPPALLDYCQSARQVAAVGLRPDLDFCMRCNVSSSVPIVVGRDTASNLLIVENAEGSNVP